MDPETLTTVFASAVVMDVDLSQPASPAVVVRADHYNGMTIPLLVRFEATKVFRIRYHHDVALYSREKVGWLLWQPEIRLTDGGVELTLAGSPTDPTLEVSCVRVSMSELDNSWISKLFTERTTSMLRPGYLPPCVPASNEIDGSELDAFSGCELLDIDLSDHFRSTGVLVDDGTSPTLLRFHDAVLFELFGYEGEVRDVWRVARVEKDGPSYVLVGGNGFPSVRVRCGSISSVPVRRHLVEELARHAEGHQLRVGFA